MVWTIIYIWDVQKLSIDIYDNWYDTDMIQIHVWQYYVNKEPLKPFPFRVVQGNAS